MAYEMDMKGEKRPIRNDVFTEGMGIRLKIIHCEEGISKKGNEQFIFEFQEMSTGKVKTVFAISLPGKRWKLKSILNACDVSAAQDGVYKWEIKDVLGKIILADVQNNEEEYTNRHNEIKMKLNTELYNIRKVEVEEKMEEKNMEEKLSTALEDLKSAEVDLGGLLEL